MFVIDKPGLRPGVKISSWNYIEKARQLFANKRPSLLLI